MYAIHRTPARIKGALEHEGTLGAAEIRLTPPASARGIRALGALDRLGIRRGHDVVISPVETAHALSAGMTIVARLKRRVTGRRLRPAPPGRHRRGPPVREIARPSVPALTGGPVPG